MLISKQVKLIRPTFPFTVKSSSFKLSYHIPRSGSFTFGNKSQSGMVVGRGGGLRPGEYGNGDDLDLPNDTSPVAHGQRLLYRVTIKACHL